MTKFDKGIQSDLSGKAQPLYVLSRALPPFRVREADGSLSGDLRGSGMLLAILRCDKKSSRLPLVTGKHFLSPDSRDPFLTQPTQLLAVHIRSLSRYPNWLSCKVPTAMIYGFPTSFSKDHLCKNIGFFSRVQDKSQWPLLLGNRGLPTVLPCADLLLVFCLCELGLCLW